jgi:CBS domain containing-hemolysin-like protein
MVLLVVYVAVALGFSFLCSIAEAVILSVTSSHISLLEQDGRPSAGLLRRLKDDVNTPLAAILTLNTIAHTAGAAGAGAQAAAIFGDQYVGVISGVLTFLILVFSEIIPKTIGAHYWRELAPATAYMLRYLILIFYPFVKLSAFLTRNLADGGPTLKGFNREEFAAMAELSTQEGQLARQELNIMKNLLYLHKMRVREIMTPRTVVFSVPAELTVQQFFAQYEHEKFSRIPVYQDGPEDMIGFVLRSDLLLAQARGQAGEPISAYLRTLNVIPDSLPLSRAFEMFLTRRDQMMQVIDEHGGMEGVVTLEDMLEKLLGFEIIDESDKTPNMRRLARRKWRRRLEKLRTREKPNT